MIKATPLVFDSINVQKRNLSIGLALIPIGIFSIILHGYSVLFVLLISVFSSFLLDFIFSSLVKKKKTEDFTVELWGLLIAFCLPYNAPWYYPILANLFAIGVVKYAFGGLGISWINPVLAGWAFVNANWAFTSTVPFSSSSPIPHTGIDQTWTASLNDHIFSWLNVNLPGGYVDLFLGFHNVSIGSGCVILLLAASVFLLVKNYIPWVIPCFAFFTFALLTLIFGGLSLHGTWFSGDVLTEIFSGDLLFGIFIIAADTFSRPLKQSGWVLYAILIGIVIFLLRISDITKDFTYTGILVAGLFVPCIDYFQSKRP